MTCTVEAGWGKGSNSLLGSREFGYSSSNFVDREILISFFKSFATAVCVTNIYIYY
jgi:hypothetical protein